MSRHRLAAKELLAKAEGFEGVRAGIAEVRAVLDGPSYQARGEGDWQDSHPEKAVTWLPKARSLLVLAMHHPPDQPSLDWFYRSNSLGNRRMHEISQRLAALHGGRYHRPACIQQLGQDRAHPVDYGQSDSQGKPIMVVDFCRRCEYACPVGRQ